MGVSVSIEKYNELLEEFKENGSEDFDAFVSDELGTNEWKVNNWQQPKEQYYY